MKYLSLAFPNHEVLKEKINNLRKLGYEIIENEEGLFTKDPSDNFIKLVVS
ncbi:MAG: hypothetical protein GX021_10340 [Tissierellia bacterium]|nr:hypothetical protein [Tissierellia bacterium]